MKKLALPSDINALVVTNPSNIFYLCGFRGFSQPDTEAILVITRHPELVSGSKKMLKQVQHDKERLLPLRLATLAQGRNDMGGGDDVSTLVTAKIYTNEANALRSKNLDVLIVPERHLIEEKAFELVKDAKRIGFEKNHMTYGQYILLKRSFGLRPQDDRRGRNLVPTEELIENQRMIKTAEEIKHITKAQQISINAFKKLLQTIKVGQTEEELRDKLEALLKAEGAHGISFETIVASGPNSGIPHYRTGKRKINKGDILLFDFGAMYKNYHADITRTIFFGKATTQYQNIYDLVKKAQTTAIKKIKNGTSAQVAYESANNIFKIEKVEDHFLHGLGHGIGLDIHEPPYLRATTNHILANNMVFSIEPGLYFPWGGVRIEDLVVLKNGKTKIL